MKDAGGTYSSDDKLYWYVKYTDIVIGADGAVKTEQLAGKTPSNETYIELDRGNGAGWRWLYSGYLTMDELYDDITNVANHRILYNCEDGILKN